MNTEDPLVVQLENKILFVLLSGYITLLFISIILWCKGMDFYIKKQRVILYLRKLPVAKMIY